MSATHPVVRYPFAEWIGRHSRLFGSVSYGWLGRPYVYLIGPEANEVVFANDQHFSNARAYKGLVPVDGPTSVIVSDGEDHKRRRTLVRPGLHHKQIDGYVATMTATADEALDTITPGVAFDAYELFRAAIRRSTLRSLFGERMADKADSLGALLQPLIDLTGLLPDMVSVHKRLRTRRWQQAEAARQQLDEFVYAEIDRLRSVPAETESQVLAVLVRGRDGSRSGLSDLEIRDQVVTLIAAGYETTSAALGWALYGLGGRPDLIERARSEVLDVTGGELPTAEQVGRLKLTDAIISEALRLYPPASVIPRYVAESFSFRGHRIPRGATLIISPYLTHRDPQLYEDPLEFRPERWLSAPHRPGGEYLPFGGGAHRCLGSVMATTELTVMLARLLARGGFVLEPRKVRATGLSAMRPRDGVWLRLTVDNNTTRSV